MIIDIRFFLITYNISKDEPDRKHIFRFVDVLVKFTIIINKSFSIIQNVQDISLGRYDALRRVVKFNNNNNNNRKKGRNKTGSDVMLALAEHPAVPRPTVH